MFRRGRARGDELEWGYDGLAGLEPVAHRGFFKLQVAPIAAMQAALQKIPRRIGIIRFELQHLLVIGDRIFESFKDNEQSAPIAQRLDVIGFDGQGLVK